MTNKDFDTLYSELTSIVKEIYPYYDVDKIKSDSVYIWTKGDVEENVFDIISNDLIFYVKNHQVIEESLPIIKKIQEKLKEIEKTLN